jgi:Flp pilus assembly protein protease CpaA
MLLLSLFTLVCLGFICYQDMRYRAVYWICFPVLAVSLFLLKQQKAEWEESLTQTALGSLFFGIQLLVLWIYFSIKNKRFVNVTLNYLGLGDILFLFAIAFYLSPVNYILFYVGSLVIVLLYTLAQRILQKKASQEIPLAGLQALLLSLLMVLSLVKPSLKPYTDSWIYGF